MPTNCFKTIPNREDAACWTGVDDVAALRLHPGLAASRPEFATNVYTVRRQWSVCVRIRREMMSHLVGHSLSTISAR
jgi:hypothetical protein